MTGDTDLLNSDKYGRYATPYAHSEDANEIRGNPAQSRIIDTLVETLKVRSLRKGAAATREHAEAMTIDDLRAIIQQSRRECPTEELTREPSGLEDLIRCYEQGLLQTMAPTGMTLWTRYERFLCGTLK